MKNYEDMSDFEINKRVFKAIVGAKPLDYPHNADGRSVGNEENGNYRWYDYCNNPADAEPIIIENRIGTIPASDNGLWKAAHRKIGIDDTPYHFTQDKNPLRAAMIVFLKMNEDKL